MHEIDGWHEAKMGVVYYNDEHQQRKNCYVGCFDNSATFGWRLWLEACRYGLRDAEEVVFLGDGASWIRSEHYRHFGRATFIIDWYHASEHIWDCGKVLLGKRLKQSGMIWKRRGSSAILSLRTVWLNNRWQQFWQNKPLAA